MWSSFWISVSDTLSSDWFRNGVIVFGVFVALISIATSRSLAQKKQSADLLFNSRGDERLQSGTAFIHEYHESADRNIRSLAGSSEQVAKDIRYLLNHFELLSVGIQNGIYDEQIVKKAWCTIVVTTYDRVLPFINASREKAKQNTYYQEFEWLALRWKSKPISARKTDK